MREVPGSSPGNRLFFCFFGGVGNVWEVGDHAWRCKGVVVSWGKLGSRASDAAIGGHAECVREVAKN